MGAKLETQSTEGEEEGRGRKGGRIFFSFFLGIIFVFQGGRLFGFLAFVAFTWVFVVFVAFHFASSAFTVPLFRILCIATSAGFLALWLLAAFWLWLFASSAFPVGWLPASSASQIPLWRPPLKYTPN